MSEIQTIVDGVVQFQLGGWTSVGRGARPLNVYLLEGKQPALVGAGHPATTRTLTDALRKYGLEPAHVHRILSGSWEAATLGGALAFPAADLLVASLDFVQPHRWADWLDERRAHVAALSEAIGDRVEKWDREAMQAYLLERFPSATNHLEFLPVRSGQMISAGSLELETIAAPGTQREHVMFWNAEHKLLFCGDLTAAGLPARVEQIEDYIVSIERAMQLEPKWILPSQGTPSPRAMPTLRRMLNFCNNFLSNVTATLAGGKTLLQFVDADLGHQPDHPAEYLEAVEDRRPFLEELFRARMIEARGDGLDRRYGTDVESLRTDLQL